MVVGARGVFRVSIRPFLGDRWRFEVWVVLLGFEVVVCILAEVVGAELGGVCGSFIFISRNGKNEVITRIRVVWRGIVVV